MKVYIAGAITDNPNYKEQFKAAEERLRAAGHAVINPCKNEGFTYREYINMGLCELMHCDAIYLLKGYENSTGATLEHDYARTVGLKIIKEENCENLRKALKELDGSIDKAMSALKKVTEFAEEYNKDWRKAIFNVFRHTPLIVFDHPIPHVVKASGVSRSLMDRYDKGERTQELYDAMMRL